MLASMQTTGEDLIGATEAAEILGVSKDTLIRMITRGDLAASKLPGANGVYLLNGPEIKEITATGKVPVRRPGRPRRHPRADVPACYGRPARAARCPQPGAGRASTAWRSACF